MSWTNQVSVSATDDDGADVSADSNEVTVSLTDVSTPLQIVKSTESAATLPEPGGNYDFKVVVTNPSTFDSVTVSDLNDTFLADLQDNGTCTDVDADTVAPWTLSPGEALTCLFTVNHTGDYPSSWTNKVSVTATDEDGVDLSADSNEQTVDLSDELPDITVTKTADQSQVFAPGEDVVFTVVIDNNSVSTDPVTLNSLTDSIHGDLNGKGTCVVPQTIPAGNSYTCSFTVLVDGDETDTVTASGTDDEGNPVSDSDTATVEMINPSIDIEKSTNGYDADTAPGPEILVGADVTWEYQVTNDGDVDLTDITVTDSVLGSVCTIDFLAAGDSTTCTATGTAQPDQYANTGTATVSYTDVDDDIANRSDSDPSHYFGAAPSIAIDKQTADDYGNEGDGVGILPGESVTWNYEVTNDGNVPLENVSVTDDQGVSVSCPQDTLAVGESMTCTASGIAGEDWYYNVGTSSGDYSDDVGNSTTVTDSDDSAYYGLTPGAVTNSSLCDFGEQFNLIFTPDFKSGNNRYKLSDSNPGQFFYNLFYAGDPESTTTFEIELPYPFVTQGSNPVHVYSGVFAVTDPDTGQTCFQPAGEIASYAEEITLRDYGRNGSFGSTYLLQLQDVPTDGFVYLNLHLDYGLEKTNGWERSHNDALNDPAINPDLEGVDILHLTDHTFSAYTVNGGSTPIPGSTDTVQNNNVWKRIRGIGGLVQEQVTLANGTTDIQPSVGEEVELWDPDGVLLDTATTDGDGWYFFANFVHKGKETTYTVRVPSLRVSGTATLGGKIKYQQVDFLIVRRRAR